MRNGSPNFIETLQYDCPLHGGGKHLFGEQSALVKTTLSLPSVTHALFQSVSKDRVLAVLRSQAGGMDI